MAISNSLINNSFKISDGVAQIRERVAQAAQRSRRDPGEVEIVAISKFVSPERIAEAIQAGIGILGENRVQELLAKYPVVQSPAAWHLVGRLQTNKVKPIIGKVDLIHSLDRYALAAEIAKQTRAAGTRVNVLVQVNVSGEPSKQGLKPMEVMPFLEQIAPLEGLAVKGLMTIAPQGDPQAARMVFREMRQLFTQVAQAEIAQVEMRYLSMGMTDDFEAAIEEGANLVRIGTGIFGKR